MSEKSEETIRYAMIIGGGLGGLVGIWKGAQFAGTGGALLFAPVGAFVGLFISVCIWALVSEVIENIGTIVMQIGAFLILVVFIWLVIVTWGH